MGSSIGKKSQLAPISFTNKSVDLKEAESAEDKKSETSKFNTSNYSDIYSEAKAGPESKVTTSFDKKFGFDFKEKQEKKEDKPQTNKNIYAFKNENESNKDKEFDDQFNEVILEDIENDNKKVAFSPVDELEDSKKSVTQSNSNALSYGFDSSVTNYKLDDFDHIEEVENPK